MSNTNTTKLAITLSEEMAATLRDVAGRENTNASAIVRYALADYLLDTYGIQVDYRLQWGGNRYTVVAGAASPPEPSR